jgi:hypothetical protein
MARQNLQCGQFESGVTERQVVSQTVLEIRGSNDETDPFTRAAMVLVGAAFVGPNVERLVQLTGYPREYVDQIASRLKASGLWKEATLDYDPWDKEKIGCTAFTMDLLIAVGACIRGEKTVSGQYQFRAVEAVEAPDVNPDDHQGVEISRSALRRMVRTSPLEIYPKTKEK